MLSWQNPNEQHHSLSVSVFLYMCDFMSYRRTEREREKEREEEREKERKREEVEDRAAPHWEFI